MISNEEYEKVKKELEETKEQKDFWLRNYNLMEEKAYKIDEINTRLGAENNRLKEMLENSRNMYSKVLDENERLHDRIVKVLDQCAVDWITKTLKGE